MELKQKVIMINDVLENYFKTHLDIYEVKAKEMMPLFIEAGIYTHDHREGLPIRDDLRTLDELNALGAIPYCKVIRKEKNRNWFFKRLSLWDKLMFRIFKTRYFAKI